MPDLETLYTGALIVGLLAQVAYVAMYSTFPWWRSQLGRALFLVALSTYLVLLVAAANRFYDIEWYDEAITAVLWLLAISLCLHTYAFYQVVRERRRKQRETDA